ncbi:MAG: phosphate ABC transporter permease subunit PstC [Anaerolineaceae bacterium]|nr:phosphate ABC transporter permease subunit PstC [Anaerolineaceae bacterium]
MATQNPAQQLVGTQVSHDELIKRPRIGETLIQGFLFLCGAISILTTIGIIYELGKEALLFFRSPDVTLFEFFTSTHWQPAILDFGIWPLVLATIFTSLLAMLVALPLGLGTAIYLSEYASERARNTLKPILEVLAGIPTVVYGYFALTFMTPLLRNIFGAENVQIFNTASAGIVVGILIIPLVSSLSEDALHAVPDGLRQAAYGLGATKLETSLKIVLPAALSGITAAFVVAISRAIGETMIVAIAAGAGPKNFDIGQDSLFGTILNPFVAAETMTGHIVRISGGDLSYDSIDYNSIFAIGLMLFLMTLGLNMLSRRFVNRFREVYE